MEKQKNMKGKQNICIALFLFLAIGFLNFSCSDADDLSEFNRLYSPASLEATVIKNTDVSLNWIANQNVKSYTLEVFEDDNLTFEGPPTMVIEGITAEQLPYHLFGLYGQTRYSVRVKSVGSVDSKWTGIHSEWVSVSFLTETENIFLPFEDEDIGPTSVTLRWKPNEKLTQIILEPGDIVHKVTEEEVTNGLATIRGLDDETTYTATLKDEDKIRGVSDFTTPEDTSDIILPFENDDIGISSVTLRWKPYERLTEITLEPGDITYKVTDEEIISGVVTISELDHETAYTATFKNRDKIRGTVKFTTLVDISDSYPVEPEDDFTAMLKNANDGDVFVLSPGVYIGEIDEEGMPAFTINKNIEIKGAIPHDKPKLNGYISLEEDGAGLLLQNIILNGDNLAGQSIVFNTERVEYNDLIVEGCEIKNYGKGVFYLNVQSLVNSITFNNNIISNIDCNGGDFLDTRKGAYNFLSFTNNTVYNSCSDRAFIRYDDASSNFPGVTPTIKVDHCTLYGVSSKSDKGIFYVRFKGNKITLTNTIVAKTDAILASNNATDANATFGGNNFFNAPNLFSATGSGSKFYDDSAESEDPGFINPDSGNFTITNELLKIKGAGDSRWIK